MRSLSIKQPWASLIAHNIKNIENRTWKTHFRGRIYIHASGQLACVGLDLLSEIQREEYEFIATKKLNKLVEYPIFAIIGEVEIIDCVQDHPSIWAEKHNDIMGEFIYKPIYNWVLANAVLYEKPILNVKGKLSFWEYKPT